MGWEAANEWEKQWWGACKNTYNEELKQFIYAHHMGMDEFLRVDHHGPHWDLGQKSVIDVGGGPCSILLKCKSPSRLVIDPCEYPGWIAQRYAQCGVKYHVLKAEDLYGVSDPNDRIDLALLYNCLQHTEDPARIVANIKKLARELRVFEWVDTGVSDGHLHNLTADLLDEWIGVGNGKLVELRQSPCVGRAYAGVFPL